MSSRTWFVIALIVIGGFVGYRVYIGDEQDNATDEGATMSVAEALADNNTAGFMRALAPRELKFPEDHGPHPQYKQEWWYFTGNLDSSERRHFGFQLTFFRIGLTADLIERESAWATNQVYMAHFTVSDVVDKDFYSFERFSRGAAGLAGARVEPFRVWLEDWIVEGAAGGSNLTVRLRAVEDEVAVDLHLESTKPIVLHGDRGLSRKNATPGNASYYYSATRLRTHGKIRIREKTFSVRGLSWMDREWSTSALDKDQVGWDWFALQLEDDREFMFYQLRKRDGSADAFSRGTLIHADGSAQPLTLRDVEIEVDDEWQSPRTGAGYPSRWRLRIPRERLDLVIEPYIPAQELDLSVRYWEGAVTVNGSENGKPIRGSGYVELTGYGQVATSE